MTPRTPQEQRDPFIKRYTIGLKKNLLVYMLSVVLVMALAAIITGITSLSRTNEQNRQLRRLVECQSSYNEVNNERTRLLSVAADEQAQADAAADKAMGRLVASLVGQATRTTIGEDLKALNVALAQKQAARARTQLERETHPVPPPPNALCGEVPG